ncbi:MAG: hypothetical protein AB7K09_17645 [Planctomycetota bacterium]
MKLQVTLGALALAIVVLMFAPASEAAAQDAMPISVTQVHTYQWEWGYVGLQPMFGFWLGDRFREVDIENVNIGGYANDTFTQEPLIGAKASIGFGSNVDWVGTEFYLSIWRDGYHGTRQAVLGGGDLSLDQWAMKLGFHIIAELVSNEAINDAGEVTKDANVGISVFGGFFYLFFPDRRFDLRQGQANDDIALEDDQIWTSGGMVIDIPIGNFITLSGYAQIQFLTYKLERLKIFEFIFGPIREAVNSSANDWNAERFMERVQIHAGGMLTFTPHFNTFGDHHWRFYGAITFSLVEGNQPEALVFSGGVNFGW